MEPNHKDMEYRYLGKTGLKVSVFSYGNMGAFNTRENIDKQKAIISKLLEKGVNFFDTAENYSSGQAESNLGTVFKELGVRRESIVVTTKLYKVNCEGSKPPKNPNDTFLSRKHIIEGMNNSLKRLQMDYVDVVYCHRPDM